MPAVAAVVTLCCPPWSDCRPSNRSIQDSLLLLLAAAALARPSTSHKLQAFTHQPSRLILHLDSILDCLSTLVYTCYVSHCVSCILTIEDTVKRELYIVFCHHIIFGTVHTVFTDGVYKNYNNVLTHCKTLLVFRLLKSWTIEKICSAINCVKLCF